MTTSEFAPSAASLAVVSSNALVKTRAEMQQKTFSLIADNTEANMVAISVSSHSTEQQVLDEAEQLKRQSIGNLAGAAAGLAVDVGGTIWSSKLSNDAQRAGAGNAKVDVELEQENLVGKDDPSELALKGEYNQVRDPVKANKSLQPGDSFDEPGDHALSNGQKPKTIEVEREEAKKQAESLSHKAQNVQQQSLTIAQLINSAVNGGAGISATKSVTDRAVNQSEAALMQGTGQILQGQTQLYVSVSQANDSVSQAAQQIQQGLAQSSAA